MHPSWILLALQLGCVVKKYDGGTTAGDPSVTGGAARAGVDFAGVEARLDALISGAEDHDQRDRLIAAADLARASKRLPPEAQAVNLNYLQQIASIEERNVPYAAPVMSGAGVVEDAGTGVVEDAGTGDTPTAPAEAAPVQVAAPAAAPLEPSDRLKKARELMDSDPRAAMAALEPCRDQPCWGLVGATWSEARDAYVYKVREEAGLRYVASRELVDVAARVSELRSVQSTLTALVRAYPDCRYAEAIQRNLDTVAAELAALDAR